MICWHVTLSTHNILSNFGFLCFTGVSGRVCEVDIQLPKKTGEIKIQSSAILKQAESSQLGLNGTCCLGSPSSAAIVPMRLNDDLSGPLPSKTSPTFLEAEVLEQGELKKIPLTRDCKQETSSSVSSSSHQSRPLIMSSELPDMPVVVAHQEVPSKLCQQGIQLLQAQQLLCQSSVGTGLGPSSCRNLGATMTTRLSGRCCKVTLQHLPTLKKDLRKVRKVKTSTRAQKPNLQRLVWTNKGRINVLWGTHPPSLVGLGKEATTYEDLFQEAWAEKFKTRRRVSGTALANQILEQIKKEIPIDEVITKEKVRARILRQRKSCRRWGSCLQQVVAA
ncbi:hypothetical protein CEUSTIGMA_g12329.t1 [Chlamydomonas eustigma]|uniref:Uncharacterized protein n=1 Tax=Chlamydomonas eustigma TaxID=1157962 RepID=A0A250XPC5_9CHLO|nr:hypothetical protein CEUSTIGMA_g12329.t1 [Chlamydomonas eustigma]|eukprot:GAX84908.1 hypothetical protein CEUSTIGMA_g12329.t1 [Chlamydomonas eustigma]